MSKLNQHRTPQLLAGGLYCPLMPYLCCVLVLRDCFGEHKYSQFTILGSSACVLICLVWLWVTGVSSHKGYSAYRRWAAEQVECLRTQTFSTYFICSELSLFLLLFEEHLGVSVIVPSQALGVTSLIWQHMVLQYWSCRKLPATTCREPEFLLPCCSSVTWGSKPKHPPCLHRSCCVSNPGCADMLYSWGGAKKGKNGNILGEVLQSDLFLKTPGSWKLRVLAFF